MIRQTLPATTAVTAAPLPRCTLATAAARASGPTTARIAAGMYVERVEPGWATPDRPLVFSGAPGATLAGADSGFVLSGRSAVRAEGCTIDDPSLRLSAARRNQVVANVSGERLERHRPREPSSLGPSTDNVIAGNAVFAGAGAGIEADASTGQRIVFDNTQLGSARLTVARPVRLDRRGQLVIRVRCPRA